MRLEIKAGALAVQEVRTGVQNPEPMLKPGGHGGPPIILACGDRVFPE